MKILSLSSFLNPTPPAGYGGTERFVHMLSNGLVEQGHLVTVLASKDSVGGLYETLQTNEDTLLDTFITAFESINPDVVHINTKNRIVLEFLRTKDLPTVITFYNNFRKTSSWVEIIKDAPSHFHFTTISNSLKERVLEALKHNGVGLPNTSIQVTGYGMDVASYQDKSIDKPRDKYIYIGVIARYKGVLDVVKAFANLEDNLLIVGPCNNSVEKAYFDEVMIYTNKSNISYFGETTDEQEKFELLSQSKALIIATGYDPKESDCHEAFGLVMLEANSVGTPVIGYAQGNIKDYIVEGVNGYKFRSLEELPKLLEKIEVTDLSADSKEYAKQYDISLVVKNYEKFFASII